MNTIVLLDSDQILRNILAAILTRIGYEVFTDGSSTAGLELIKDKKPDLIVIDDTLSDSSGLDVCRALLNEEFEIKTLLMITSSENMPSKAFMNEHSIVSFLLKPFDNNAFIEKVTAILPLEVSGKPSDLTEAAQFELINPVENMKHYEQMKCLIRRIVLLNNCWEVFLRSEKKKTALSQLMELADFTDFGGAVTEHNELYKTTRGLDIFIQKLWNQHPQYSTDMTTEIEKLLKKLKNHTITMVADSEISSIYFENLKILSNIEHNRAVYITAEPDKDIHHLKEFLEHRDYEVKLFSDLYDLMVFTSYEPAAAIILDYSLIKGSSQAVSLLKHITKPELLAIPLIFISEERDYRTRMKAIQASGQAFFPKPFICNHIEKQLRYIIHNYYEEPFRILYIENEGAVSQSIMFLLNSTGMEVESVYNIPSSLDIIPLFNPDCILVGNNPSPSKSREFIKVMSQFTRFQQLPVIFLSEKKNAESIPLTSSSPYSFISYQTSPAVLTSAIRIHAGKYRKQKEDMRFDEITGLLNTKTFKKQLDTEISRAYRQKKHLVLSYLEIENYQQIIQSEGMPVYEKILSDFAEQLKTFIRKIDILGFVGKNRFAVLFTQNTKENARIAVTKIQDIFYDLDLPGETPENQITLICGMAEYPDYDSRPLMMFSAEKALFNARKKGNGAIICSVHKEQH